MFSDNITQNVFFASAFGSNSHLLLRCIAAVAAYGSSLNSHRAGQIDRVAPEVFTNPGSQEIGSAPSSKKHPMLKSHHGHHSSNGTHCCRNDNDTNLMRAPLPMYALRTRGPQWNNSCKTEHSSCPVVASHNVRKSSVRTMPCKNV